MSVDAIATPVAPAPAAPVAAPPAAPPTPVQAAPAPVAPVAPGGPPAAQPPNEAAQRILAVLEASKAEAAAAKQHAAALEQKLGRYAPLDAFVEAMAKVTAPPQVEVDPWTEYQNAMNEKVQSQAQVVDQQSAALASFAAQNLQAAAAPAIAQSGLTPASQKIAEARLAEELRTLPFAAPAGQPSLSSMTPQMVQGFIRDRIVPVLKAHEDAIFQARSAPPPAPLIVPPGQSGPAAAGIEPSQFKGSGGVRSLYAQLYANGIQPV